ncbi:MAG: SDR family NAD(P)-dependent oxidoreductase [Planctomycetota bacterium]|nr:MAG: SDR family NAD(P)-dependent oxidoreductase [Planctomycetota bacterium]
MSFDFAERDVVVTGGSGALGAAVVALLVQRGATCYVPCYSASQLDRFEYLEHERVKVETGVNLFDEESAVAYFDSLPTPWACLNIAGGFAASRLAETGLDDFRKMLDMNASTCFLATREAVKKMRASSDTEGGRIVNVGAKPALVPKAGLAAYAASKAAVISLTLCLAEELRDDGIWVNAVVPSIIDTPVNRDALPDADHERWPSPADVAETIAFLASPLNRATRGAVVPVYGLS